MSNAIRWILRIAGLLLALIVYTIWKQLDAQLGNGFPSAFLRGAIVFAFIGWMWHATRARKEASVNAVAATQPMAEQTKPSANASTDVPEDQFWAQALGELDTESRQAGLWARCFAEAQGNESVARANYLNVRARQLADAQRAEALEAREAEEHAKKEAEAARLLEEQRRYEVLPKGHCPNCAAVILLSAEECPKCRASFAQGSSWTVKPI